jgi:hypothetical protein
MRRAQTSSKPVGPGSPRVGRFDSFAAPLYGIPLRGAGFRHARRPLVKRPTWVDAGLLNPASEDFLSRRFEEEVASVRTGALGRFGLTPRETEVLRAATAMDDEADIAWELFRIFTPSGSGSRLQAKLGVQTAADAVARALRESA